MALKQITKYAGSAENIVSKGDSAWQNVDNIFSDDSNYSTGTIYNVVRTVYTDRLHAYNFGFEIPKNAVIKGILMTFGGNSEFDIGLKSDIYDNEIYLSLNGIVFTENKKNTTIWDVPFLGTEARNYGGSSDLWSALITPSVVNNINFGVVIEAVAPYSGAIRPANQPKVNYVSLTIYYEDNEEFETEQENQVELSEKQFYAKIFSPTGIYITTLLQDDFNWKPEFTLNINDGLSGIRPKLVYDYADMKYPSTGIVSAGSESIQTIAGVDKLYDGIRLGNLIAFYISDKEVLNKRIYTGYIAGFKLDKSGEKLEISLDIVPNVARFSALMLKDDDDTTVAYLSQDPADMVKDIINKTAVLTDYNENTVYDTGVSRTYTFISQTILEALKKIIQLCPYGWFFYIGGDDKVYLKNFTNENHITKHLIPMINISAYSMLRSIYNLRNKVYFLGGGTPQMYRVYEKTGSVNSFGLFEEKMVDERVTLTATADEMADRYLKEQSKPTTEISVEILDSNYSNKGYDIESINVGDTIILQDDEFSNSQTTWGNFIWGQAYWLYNLYDFIGIPAYIQSIEYKYDRIVVNCVAELPAQDNRIEDVNRDLTNFRFKDAPDTPTEA